MGDREQKLIIHSMEAHLYYDAFAGVFLIEASRERIHKTLRIEKYKKLMVAYTVIKLEIQKESVH